MAKWLKITIISLLISVLIGASVWLIFFSGYLDKSKKYSYDDLQDMYNAGVADTSKKIVILQAQIDDLNVQIELKNNRIKDLQDLITSLSEENERIPGLEKEIEDLQKDNADLVSLVNRLRAELDIYCNDLPNRVIVTFYKDDNVYKELSIRENGSIFVEVPEPTKDGYIFDGWSLNNEIIDITTYSFTQDERLDAVFSVDDTLLHTLNNVNSENCLYFNLLDNSNKSYFYFKNENIGLFANGYYFDNVVFTNNNNFVAHGLNNNAIVECSGYYTTDNKQLTITFNNDNYSYYYVGIVQDIDEDYLTYSYIEPSDYLSRIVMLSYDKLTYFGFDYKYNTNYTFEDINVNEVKKIIITNGIEYVPINFLDNFVNLEEIDFYGTAMQWFGQHTETGLELVDNFKIDLNTPYVVNCSDGIYQVNSDNKLILKFYASGHIDGYSRLYDNLLYHVAMIDKDSLYLTSIGEPAKAGYSFVGWSDGQNIIDMYTYHFNSSVDLYAEYEFEAIPDGKYKVSCERIVQSGENSSKLIVNVTFISVNNEFSIDSSANNSVVVEKLTGNGAYYQEGTDTDCLFRINAIASIGNALKIDIREYPHFTIQLCYCPDENVLNTSYFDVSNIASENWYYTTGPINVSLEIIDLY